MGKIVWTEKKVQEMFDDGHGHGEGADYKPFILVQHVASKGRARRAWSPKTNRTHHLLSDGEAMAFYAAEWCLEVEDIREAFPLPRDETRAIAEQLGIRHPMYPGTQVEMVLTVDFLLTVRVHDEQSLIAINVKVDAAADEPRDIEKLEIQRQFFAQNNCKHHLLFKSRMPAQEIRNIEMIRRAYVKPNEPPEFVGQIPELETAMTLQIPNWEKNPMPLNVYCMEFDGEHGLAKGTGLRVAQILMGKRVTATPLHSNQMLSEPLAMFATPTSISFPKVGT